jgi:hypothetical protein
MWISHKRALLTAEKQLGSKKRIDWKKKIERKTYESECFLVDSNVF